MVIEITTVLFAKRLREPMLEELAERSWPMPEDKIRSAEEANSPWGNADGDEAKRPAIWGFHAELRRHAGFCESPKAACGNARRAFRLRA